jgi:hypothetical protein
MKTLRSVLAPLAGACMAACSATGDAQRPPIVVGAVAQAVDGLVAETQKRLATESFRGLPVVVRNGSGDGTESVLVEMLRTRLVERSVAVEVACPSKCLEITLVEFFADAGAAAPVPGQVLPIKPDWPTLPRSAAGPPLSSGQVAAALATFATRDANRYGVRQPVIAVLAIAKSPDAAR